jgi:hypothetical protein
MSVVERLKAYWASRWAELCSLASRLWRKLTESHYRLYELRCWWTGYEDERERTANRIGYEPDLQNPETINEKIIWKKINVRDPLLTRTTDKIKVRDYVREKLGEDAEDLIIPLLHVADRPRALPLEACEVPYVIKTNHASETSLFVHDRLADDRFVASTENAPKSVWTREELIEQGTSWLQRDHGFHKHEWAYRGIERKVFIEPFLSDPYGDRLTDAKLDCFHGEPTYVLLIVNSEDGRRFSLLDEHGHRVEGQHEGPSVPEAVVQNLRSQLSRLRAYASRLSEDFDHCRVDFYVRPEGLYFSEITHYPSSGYRQIQSRDFEREMGRHWNIDSSSAPSPLFRGAGPLL